MSVSQGLPNYLSSVANIGTRVQGPALAGQQADNVGGPFPYAGGFICIQSTSSITNQTVTPSTGTLDRRASFVYIPVSTISFIGQAAPPYVGVGTPLVWNDAGKTLMVWSSGATSWMMLTTAGGVFTSSST